MAIQLSLGFTILQVTQVVYGKPGSLSPYPKEREFLKSIVLYFLRYMAPEVARCLPYDQTVDAYSFGILFWQICSLTTPYAKYSLKMHAERIVRQGHRPKQDGTWPPTWIQLQQSCWSTDRSARPPFSSILKTLREQVDMMEDGVVPSRASEIRAKNKRKRIVSNKLDVDTRKSSSPTDVQKRFETEVV